MFLLVDGLEALEDGHGLLRGRGVELDGLEAALERAVFLDAAKLLGGGRADDGDGAVRQRLLEDVGRVHRAFGRARADQLVDLVDEEDDAALGLAGLVDDALHAFLELAAARRAGHQRVEVQAHDVFAREQGRLARDDEARQALDEGGLAHAGLAVDERVALLQAQQDFDDLAHVGGAADERAQLLRGGQARQVHAVFREGGVVGGRKPGHAARVLRENLGSVARGGRRARLGLGLEEGAGELDARAGAFTAAVERLAEGAERELRADHRGHAVRHGEAAVRGEVGALQPGQAFARAVHAALELLGGLVHVVAFAGQAFERGLLGGAQGFGGDLEEAVGLQGADELARAAHGGVSARARGVELLGVLVTHDGLQVIVRVGRAQQAGRLDRGLVGGAQALVGGVAGARRAHGKVGQDDHAVVEEGEPAPARELGHGVAGARRGVAELLGGGFDDRGAHALPCFDAAEKLGAEGRGGVGVAARAGLRTREVLQAGDGGMVLEVVEQRDVAFHRRVVGDGFALLVLGVEGVEHAFELGVHGLGHGEGEAGLAHRVAQPGQAVVDVHEPPPQRGGAAGLGLEGGSVAAQQAAHGLEDGVLAQGAGLFGLRGLGAVFGGELGVPGDGFVGVRDGPHVGEGASRVQQLHGFERAAVGGALELLVGARALGPRRARLEAVEEQGLVVAHHEVAVLQERLHQDAAAFLGQAHGFDGVVHHGPGHASAAERVLLEVAQERGGLVRGGLPFAAAQRAGEQGQRGPGRVEAERLQRDDAADRGRGEGVTPPGARGRSRRGGRNGFAERRRGRGPAQGGRARGRTAPRARDAASRRGVRSKERSEPALAPSAGVSGAEKDAAAAAWSAAATGAGASAGAAARGPAADTEAALRRKDGAATNAGLVSGAGKRAGATTDVRAGPVGSRTAARAATAACAPGARPSRSARTAATARDGPVIVTSL